MGSDHSTTGASKPPVGHHRSSPSGSSISSGDIPYTFYTVGRPIGGVYPSYITVTFAQFKLDFSSALVLSVSTIFVYLFLNLFILS